MAQQSNLSGLNVAIEAVRARELGRWSSIVAEEIRKLADESNKSIKANIYNKLEKECWIDDCCMRIIA